MAFQDKITAFAESIQTVQEAQKQAKQTKALSGAILRLQAALTEEVPSVTIGSQEVTKDVLSEVLEGLTTDVSVIMPETDKLAKLLISLQENEMLSKTETSKVDELLETYKTLKVFNVRTPRSSEEGAEESKVDFPFPIDAIWTGGSKEYVWHEGSRSGKGSRWNSMRHFVRLQIEKEELGTGALKGHNVWLSEWKAAKDAFDSGATEADIPSFDVTLKRVA